MLDSPVREPDPVVISGMAVEAPGGVDSPAAFWSALAAGRELLGPFPADRQWSTADLVDVPNAGGFLDSAAEFDPGFFGISPREAIAMDPQQRVALRVAWRALEHCGVNPSAPACRQAGCYLGASVTEYGPPAAEVNEHTGHRVTGTALGAVAGRVSHCLGLIGPSLTVDAACASSLAALHLAANAIRAGECDWALAGGVCVMGSPAAFVEFAAQNALAADGHCRAYSADATGTVWGEGAGVVVLERQSRAHALGHRVYARVLGTRVNHNGGGAPLTVPSADAQQRLIRATLAAAGVEAGRIGMIEGHGTATPTGDPLELSALLGTYGADPDGGALLGSVKSNCGHAQAASGALGLIKLVLSGFHAHIPATLFAERPSTAVDWEAASVRLAARGVDWAARDGVRYGAVSSFGVAGSNAHAVLAMPEPTETAHV
jgi:mycobactin polyketide synthetase MbtC